ncbi:MAG: aminopeptidase P family protein [Defluviitaleaceae bacterium]|nr:aminopeptidase P family protein [Defluviitaleaceae bacterium]
MSELYVANRKNFGDAMENGSMLVVFAGTAPVKRGDEFYPFAPQRNFYYMTGIDRQNLVFVQYKDAGGEVKCRLYLERYDEHVAKWDGAALNKETAKEISGIEDFAYIDELNGHIASAFLRTKIHTVYLDMENRSLTVPNTPELDFAKLLREKFPMVRLENAFPMFATLRLIKSDVEIEYLRKAAQITGEGFEVLLRNAKPGIAEYELEAHLDYIYRKNGCSDRAFRTIMASGKNACVLHYSDNNCTIGPDDLVLVDFGAQWKWYSADVSRTFPANGKFNDRQKTLYNIVLGALELVIDMIKPGVVFGTLNEAVLAYYEKELAAIGLISGKNDIVKYYFHGVSHMLGLETHDVGSDKDLVLAPGMVFTVEPGLYIAEEGIGIRIEDDVLVTTDGCENLTGHIIKSVDDIERFMAAVPC